MRAPRAQLCTLLFVLLLTACGDDPQLPIAHPLKVNRDSIDTLPGAMAGPHTTKAVRDLHLPGTADQRDLALNLYFPGEGRGYPLLLFSHGNWSDKDSYDRIIEHWVSHGYSVIAPNHLDCCNPVMGIINSLRYGQLGLIEARRADLASLLARLPTVEQLHPEFAGKADPLRLAITGHSFGAFSAQQFGGAAALDPDTGKYRSKRDQRVAAIVAISPPGPMFDTITEQSWLNLSTPTLVSTGTWDVQPTFWPDWRMHLMSWETALPGDKYALVTEGADHYLGGLICRLNRDEPPQEDALLMMQLATTTFLNAFLKEDEAARTFLHSTQLSERTAGFSRLSAR